MNSISDRENTCHLQLLPFSLSSQVNEPWKFQSITKNLELIICNMLRHNYLLDNFSKKKHPSREYVENGGLEAIMMSQITSSTEATCFVLLASINLNYKFMS